MPQRTGQARRGCLAPQAVPLRSCSVIAVAWSAIASAASVSDGRRSSRRRPRRSEPAGRRSRALPQLRLLFLEFSERRDHGGDVAVIAGSNRPAETPIPAPVHDRVSDTGRARSGRQLARERQAPHRQQTAPSGRTSTSVRSGATTSVLASSAAACIGQAFVELGPHDAFERQHQPLQFAVETLEGHAPLHDGDGDGARGSTAMTTRLYQAVRRARIDQFIRASDPRSADADSM